MPNGRARVHPPSACVTMDLVQDQRWTSIAQVEDAGPLRPPRVPMDPVTVDVLEHQKFQGSSVALVCLQYWVVECC